MALSVDGPGVTETTPNSFEVHVEVGPIVADSLGLELQVFAAGHNFKQGNSQPFILNLVVSQGKQRRACDKFVSKQGSSSSKNKSKRQHYWAEKVQQAPFN